MRTFAKDPGPVNVEALSTELVVTPKVMRPADLLWLHLFFTSVSTALYPKPVTRRRRTSIALSTSETVGVFDVHHDYQPHYLAGFTRLVHTNYRDRCHRR